MDIQEIMKELSILFKGNAIRHQNALCFHIEGNMPVQVIFEKEAMDLLEQFSIDDFRSLVNGMIDDGKLVASGVNESILHFSEFYVANHMMVMALRKVAKKNEH